MEHVQTTSHIRQSGSSRERSRTILVTVEVSLILSLRAEKVVVSRYRAIPQRALFPSEESMLGCILEVVRKWVVYISHD
jgi:hypothetical protein